MPRGRPRDEDARDRVLAAAFELVGGGHQGPVTVNAIAASAGVAKQTIYRWWPSRTALVLDALVEGTMRATPFRTTDDARADFERHARSVARLFASPTGTVIRKLVAELHSDPERAREFLDRFWSPRRALSSARLEAAMAAGEVRADLDVEAVLDAIYGPLWVRLLVGHGPLRPADAGRVVELVWSGISPARRGRPGGGGP